MIQNNGDVIGLSRFIITRILGNPDIACEFSHPSVPHLYRDGKFMIKIDKKIVGQDNIALFDGF